MSDQTSAVTHSPGPWTVKLHACFGDDGQPIVGMWVEAGEYRSVANVMPHREGASNAHLIAAAPDLLAALKAALPWIAIAMVARDPETTHPQAIANHAEDLALVQAAIAKAEKG